MWLMVRGVISGERKLGRIKVGDLCIFRLTLQKPKKKKKKITRNKERGRQQEEREKEGKLRKRKVE